MEQKLQIVQEAEQDGISQTFRKHNFAQSPYLRLKNQFNQGSAKLLEPQYRKVHPEIKALQKKYPAEKDYR